MKKITKLISVLALSGAALLLAGCAKDYSADIQELQDRVNDLEQAEVGDISAVQKQVDAIKAEIKTITGNIATVKEQLQQADAALDAKKVDKTTYEAKVAELNNSLSALQTELAQKVAELANAIDKARTDASTQISDLSNAINTKLAELKAAYEAADAKLAQAIKDGDEAAVAKVQAELKNEVDKLKAEIQQAKSDLTNAIGKVETEYKNADQSIIASINALKTELVNKIDGVDAALKSKIEELDKAYKAADTKLAEKIATEVQTINNSIAAEVAKLTSKIETEVAKVEAAYKKADENIIADYTAKITALETKLDNAVAKLEQADKDLKKAVEDGDNALKTLIEAEVSARETEIAAVKALISSEINKLQVQIDDLQDEDAAIKAEFAQKVSDLNDKIIAAVAELDNKISTAKSDLNDKINTVASISADKDAEIAAAFAAADAQIIKSYEAAISALKVELNGEIAKVAAACKEADEAIIADYTAKIDAANESIRKEEKARRDAVTELEKKIKNLEEASAKGDTALAKKIIAEIVKIEVKIAEIDQDIVDLEARVNTKIADLAAEYKLADTELKAELNGKISDLKAELADKVNELNAAIAAGDTKNAEALLQAVSALNDKILAASNTLTTAFQTADTDLYTKITNETALLIADVYGAIRDVEAEVKRVDEAQKANAQRLEDLIDAAVLEIAGVKGVTKEQGQAILDAFKAIGDLKAVVESNKTELEGKIDDAAEETFNNATTYAVELVKASGRILSSAIVAGDSTTRAKLDAKIAELAKWVAAGDKENADKIAALQKEVAQLKIDVDKADLAMLDKAKAYANDCFGVAMDVIDNTNAELGDLKTVVGENYKNLSKQISDLKDFVNAQVSDLEKKINSEVSTLEKNIDSKYAELAQKIKDGDATTLALAKAYTDGQITARLATIEAVCKSYTDTQIALLAKNVDTEFGKTNAAVLAARLEAYNADVALHARVQHEMDSTANELTKAYKAADVELATKLHNEIVALDKKVDSLVVVLRGEIATAKVEAIQVAKDWTNARVDSLRNASKEKFDALDKVDEELGKNIEEVYNTLDQEIKDQVKVLNEKIDTEVEALKGKIDNEVKKLISLMNEEDSRLQKQITNLKTELQAVVVSFNTAIKSNTSRIENIEGQMIHVEEVLNSINGTLETYGKNIKDLFASDKILNTRIDSVIIVVNDLKERVGVDESNIATNKENINKLFEVVDSLKKAGVIVNNKIDTLNKRLTQCIIDREAFIETVKQLDSRISKIEAAIQSISTLAPTAENYEIKEFWLDDQILNNVRFRAKFQVRPAEAVNILKNRKLKLHVMEGVSRSAQQGGPQLTADLEFDPFITEANDSTGIVEVFAMVPHKAVPDNVYYFALNVVDTTAEATSNTNIMSDYVKAYHNVNNPWKIEEHLGWKLTKDTTLVYKKVNYEKSFDWYELLQGTGRKDVWQEDTCKNCNHSQALYVTLDGKHYITLKAANKILGNETLAFSRNVDCTERAYYINDQVQSSINEENSPVIVDFVWTPQDSINSWLPFRADTLGKDKTLDIRNFVKGTVIVSADVVVVRGSKGVRTDFTSTFTINVTKHDCGSIDAGCGIGKYWSYLTPVCDTTVISDTISIPAPHYGDTWDNPGFISESFNDVFVAPHTMDMGTTLEVWSLKHEDDSSKFIFKSKVNEFKNYLVDDTLSVSVDNGHNKATFKVRAFVTGAANISYKQAFTNHVIDWTKMGSDEKCPALSPAGTDYWIKNNGTAPDSVDVKNIVLPSVNGKPVVSFTGVDYMLGGKYSETEFLAYRDSLQKLLGNLFTQNDQVALYTSVQNGGDSTKLYMRHEWVDYGNTYYYNFKKENVFGPQSLSTYKAYTSVQMIDCPFEIKVVPGHHYDMVYGKAVNKEYVVDSIYLQKMFQVYKKNSNELYTDNEGALKVLLTKDTVRFDIKGFLYYGNDTTNTVFYNESTRTQRIADINVTKGRIDTTQVYTMLWYNSDKAKGRYYSGRKQSVSAKLTYGPVNDLTIRHDANTAKDTVEVALPFDTTATVCRPIDFSARRAGHDTSMVISDSIFVMAYIQNKNYDTGEETLDTTYNYVQDLRWIDAGDGLFKAPKADKSFIQGINAYCWMPDTELEIDWQKRYGTLDGDKWDAPTDRVWLSIGGAGRLRLHVSGISRAGEYKLYLPVKTKYYLNFEDGVNRAKEIPDGVLVITIGKPLTD